MKRLSGLALKYSSSTRSIVRATSRFSAAGVALSAAMRTATASSVACFEPADAGHGTALR